MIVPISLEIHVTASFFFSHTLYISPVSCMSSQINGLRRCAGEGCFQWRFTELISALACCQHIQCRAISPGVVLHLSLFALLPALSLFLEEKTDRNWNRAETLSLRMALYLLDICVLIKWRPPGRKNKATMEVSKNCSLCSGCLDADSHKLPSTAHV